MGIGYYNLFNVKRKVHRSSIRSRNLSEANPSLLLFSPFSEELHDLIENDLQLAT